MNTSLLEQQNYFGLFELDEAGTVLYSRVEPDGRAGMKGPDLAGQNFFEEVLPFENSAEFRRRIASFAKSSSEADNFIFNCRINSASQPIRVLLARIRNRGDQNQSQSILLHIRKSSP